MGKRAKKFDADEFWTKRAQSAGQSYTTTDTTETVGSITSAPYFGTIRTFDTGGSWVKSDTPTWQVSQKTWDLLPPDIVSNGVGFLVRALWSCGCDPLMDCQCGMGAPLWIEVAGNHLTTADARKAASVKALALVSALREGAPVSDTEPEPVSQERSRPRTSIRERRKALREGVPA